MAHAKLLGRSNLRDADISDIPMLAAIEAMCFDGDRVSLRSFRHLMTHGHCRVLVDGAYGKIRGYVLILFRNGSRCARLYSIATHPLFLRRGVGMRLVRGAQGAAYAAGCSELRLEIRQDNLPSLRLFQQAGYHLFGQYQEYYEDGMGALRFRKILCNDTSILHGNK